MILYLDTSSLVKIYVPEIETAAVQRLVDAAEVIASSSLAYVEARAAFARKRRERDLSARDYRDLVQDFDHDWDKYLIVDASDAVIKLAGRLAEKHALRAYDAVHLASAVTVRKEGDRPVSFSCFDARLLRAARREGLRIAS